MRMQQSWLLRYSLLIVAATGEALTYNHETESIIEVASSVLRRQPRLGDRVLHDLVPEAIEQEIRPGRLLHSMTDPTSVPAEREAPALQIPLATPMPSLRKRQDDGQIQALSAQLQALSQSATEAISSVSSSASSILSQMSQSAQSVRQSADQATQSIRQSANQAVQSANQAADQANRQLSQTASSASSAVSAANSRASDQISQSLASMSSRIASVQSSASNAISSARVAASQFAASQIQAAQASANVVTGGANPPAAQARSNSLPTSIVAIIITVSIIATAVLSTVSTCLFLRYRRRKRPTRGEKALANNEKPIAVRGSPSPRFPRFGEDSRSPADEFKLPKLSPLLRSKKAQLKARENIGSASSSNGDQEDSTSSERVVTDVDAVQPAPFRLQKDNGVGSATAVRLIRVGSDKSKARSSVEMQQIIPESIPPVPVVTAPGQSSTIATAFTQSQPATQPPPQADTLGIIAQPPKSKETSPEERRISARSARTIDTETPGWRPPVRLTATDPNRFRFRDSSDLESGEPTPTNTDTIPPSSSNIQSLRTPRQTGMPGQANRGNFNRTVPPGQPKNARGTFATFPRVRNEPARESIMNRGRPSLGDRASRLRQEDGRE